MAYSLLGCNPTVISHNIQGLNTPEKRSTLLREIKKDVFVLCPEEPPECLKSHDDCLQAYQPRPIESCSVDVFVLCPEEPPESLKSHDDCLQAYQPRPMESCSVDKCVQCPEESPEPVTSYDGGLKPIFEVIRSCLTVYLGIISKIYLRFIQSKTQFKLDFGHHSQYNKRPRKEPARKLFSISPYGILKKSDSPSRDLLPAAYLSSSLMLKVMLTSLFQSVVSETQSLMYYHTGVYQQDKCPFRFEAVGFVNDQQIDKYDHDRKCDVPVASWMEKHEDESYWDRETNYRRGWEKVFEDNLRILKHRLNDSSVFLTLQLMYGCKRNTDGSVRGHYQYALNGRDFLYLDDKSSLWTPVLYEAQISADRWNSDPIIAKSVIGYLTQHCTNALQKYISLGEPELNKRVPPEVKVWSHHQSDGITRLQCLVYGFHPRPVDVKWVRNGQDDVPSDEMTPILPHPDGTYQIRVSVEVPTREGDTYSCHVDHSSLEDETLSVIWDPNANSKDNMPIIIGVVVMLIVASVIGFLIYRKRCTGKKPANPNTYVQAPIMAPANPNTYVPAPSNDGNSSTVTHPTAECNDGNSSTVTHPTAE